MKNVKKKIVWCVLLVGLIPVLILGLPLLVGIWLPDLISAPQNTLAEKALADGNTFRVIQYWNRCDFYTTFLLHQRPNGTTTNYLLDADDSKTWWVPIVVNEQARKVTVTLGGNRVREINW